jgi:peptide/nickel transport system substrate-binding protein
MPAPALRQFAALLALAGAAVNLGSCRDQPEGSVRVLVVGEHPPRLQDPSQSPLSEPDAVLLANVAQGLVALDASGNIVAGLAERWNVSDDGLSYIFRLASGEWPDGRRITAYQVARLLKRQIGPRSKNPLKDTLGAVEDVVAMTERVIEIRLVAPRPNLLPLLASPQFAVVRDNQGTGPFVLSPGPAANGDLRLTRKSQGSDEDEGSRDEEVLLATAPSAEAVRAFAAGKADVVLGGTYADLPYARRVRLPRNSLRFDPAAGLFGLLPVSSGGPFAGAEWRRLLSQAIDRDALVVALNVPGLAGRATVLEPGLDGLPNPVQPLWFSVPLAQRRPTLVSDSGRLAGAEEKPVIRLFLPESPGAEIVLARLAADWAVLGFGVERTSTARNADFQLVDAVAPSASAAWYVRSFRCGLVPICSEAADTLMDAARLAPVPAQRSALLTQAAAAIDDAQLFIPLTAPVRWSLITDRIQGFAGNRYARHTLTGLEARLGTGGS